MFKGAETKLEDSRFILDQLKAASDAPSFRSQFSSFLNASRAITYALQKDGRHISGFNSWYQAKQEEMEQDELLKFMHTARTEDFHEGKHRLDFATYVRQLVVGPPPFPNADAAIGAEGPLWTVDKGTPQERRIPMRQSGDWLMLVKIANAPAVHRGRKLEKNDPLTLCHLVLEYFSELVCEAKIKFASESAA
jgi:hypothetical protein